MGFCTSCEFDIPGLLCAAFYLAGKESPALDKNINEHIVFAANWICYSGTN